MLKLGKHKIELFESIDDLPFNRFNAFNKYIMLDAELGSTIADFDQKTVKIHNFLSKEMVDDALNELYNLRNTVHNAQTENNLRGFAFASLIRRIDGELITDYSNENLRLILDQLSEWDLTKSIVYTKSDEVKKK